MSFFIVIRGCFVLLKRKQGKIIGLLFLWLLTFQVFLLVWLRRGKTMSTAFTWTLNRNTSEKRINVLSKRVIPNVLLKNLNSHVPALQRNATTINESTFTIIDSISKIPDQNQSEGKYVVIIPHKIHNIRLGLHALQEKDQQSVKFLGQMLQLLDELDGATCLSHHQINVKSPVLSGKKLVNIQTMREAFTNSSWCNFARRDWSIQIRNTGKIRSLNHVNFPINQGLTANGSTAVRNLIVQLCNVINGPFVLRKDTFVKIGNLRPNFGRLSILDFFLRSKGKLKLGKFGNCIFSAPLFHTDRASLEGLGDFPEYSNFGASHGILRIVKEDRIEWTKCAANGMLCKETPYVPPSTLPQAAQPVCCSVVLSKMLKAVTDVLVKLGIKHRVVYGTLLGAYRSKSIIPWSHDVDISLERAHTNNHTFYSIVQEYLKDQYYVGKSFMGMSRGIPLLPAHIDIRTTAFFDGDNDFQGDKLFSPEIINSVRDLLPVTNSDWRSRGYMDFYTAPEIWWKGSSVINIDGNSYITVKDVEYELKNWYGKNYMKPALEGSWRGMSDQGASVG